MSYQKVTDQSRDALRDRTRRRAAEARTRDGGIEGAVEPSASADVLIDEAEDALRDERRSAIRTAAALGAGSWVLLATAWACIAAGYPFLFLVTFLLVLVTASSGLAQGLELLRQRHQLVASDAEPAELRWHFAMSVAIVGASRLALAVNLLVSCVPAFSAGL